MIFECFWMLLDIFCKILGLVYLVSLGFLYQKRGLHVWEEWCRGVLHQRRAEGTGPSIAFRLAFHIQNEDQRRPVAYAAAVKLFVALPGRAAAARGTAPLAQCVLDARASALLRF